MRIKTILSSVLEARELGQLPLAKTQSHNDIDQVLERSFENLHEVHIMVQKLSNKQYSDKGTLHVDRLKWLTQVKKAGKLQEYSYFQKYAIPSIISDADVREILETLQLQTQFSVHRREHFMEKQEVQLQLLRDIAQVV